MSNRVLRFGKTRVLAVSGFSSSGKTTLTQAIVKELTKTGYKVAYVKHTNKTLNTEKEGSDTQTLALAGAEPTVLISGNEVTLRGLLISAEKVLPKLEALVKLMDEPDLLLIEGFKQARIPRIEVLGLGDTRSGYLNSQCVPLLIACSEPPNSIIAPANVTVVGRDNLEQIVKLVKYYIGE